MATYNKKLKTLEIHLMLDGANPITIVDTADDDKATRALNEFKKYGTMHYEAEESGIPTIHGIPYHAVQYIKVTESDASVSKADPYGCEEPTYKLTFYNAEKTTVLSTMDVVVGESVALPEVECPGGGGDWVDSDGNRYPFRSTYTPESDMDFTVACFV